MTADDYCWLTAWRARLVVASLDKLQTRGLVGLCPVWNFDAARAGWVDLASFHVIAASSSLYGQIGPVQNDSSSRKWLGPTIPGQAVRPTA